MKLSNRSYLIAILLSTSLCITSTTGMAQTDSTTNTTRNKIAIGLLVQPLYVVSNALKFDLELQKPEGRFSYVLSPEFYSGHITDTSIPKANRNEKYPDRINGFGLGLQQKLKFRKQVISPYFAYGVTYRRLQIKYKADGFYPFEEDGLSYYGYGPVENPMKINSLLLNAQIGVQALEWELLLLDLYVGIGYKIVNIEMSDPGARRYNKMFFSPAYEGPLMMCGIKLGAQIKK